MRIKPRQSSFSSSSLTSPQPRTAGAVFVGMFRPAGKLLAAIGEWRRARQATTELEDLEDRVLADIGLSREDVPFVVRGGIGPEPARIRGPARSRRSLAALAVVTATVAGLTFAGAPARAEGEGNGDPFALHVPGQAVSVGPTGHAQAGMDAGPRTFGPLPATREVQAAPAPQSAPGRFAFQP